MRSVVLASILMLAGCVSLSPSYTNAPQSWQCGGTGDYCDSPKWFIRMEM